MRAILAAFLGVCLLCLASGCGGGSSNSVERPKNPAPIPKDVKASLSSGGGSKAAPAAHSVPAVPPQK